MGSAILVISMMLLKGSQVNELKMTHEFWQEKISEHKAKKFD